MEISVVSNSFQIKNLKLPKESYDPKIVLNQKNQRSSKKSTRYAQEGGISILKKNSR